MVSSDGHTISCQFVILYRDTYHALFRHEVTTFSGHAQAFTPQLSVAARNRQVALYTYSQKRSRTRTSSAFATSCRRDNAGSERPFTIALIACRLTPTRRASSTSLTFFSSSPVASSAATQTFPSSFCLLLIVIQKMGRTSRPK